MMDWLISWLIDAAAAYDDDDDDDDSCDVGSKSIGRRAVSGSSRRLWTETNVTVWWGKQTTCSCQVQSTQYIYWVLLEPVTVRYHGRLLTTDIPVREQVSLVIKDLAYEAEAKTFFSKPRPRPEVPRPRRRPYYRMPRPSWGVLEAKTRPRGQQDWNKLPLLSVIWLTDIWRCSCWLTALVDELCNTRTTSEAAVVIVVVITCNMSLDCVSGTLCLSHYVTEISHLHSLRDFWRHLGLCRAAAHSDCCFSAPCTNILTYLLDMITFESLIEFSHFSISSSFSYRDVTDCRKLKQPAFLESSNVPAEPAQRKQPIELPRETEPAPVSPVSPPAAAPVPAPVAPPAQEESEEEELYDDAAVPAHQEEELYDEASVPTRQEEPPARSMMSQGLPRRPPSDEEEDEDQNWDGQLTPWSV